MKSKRMLAAVSALGVAAALAAPTLLASPVFATGSRKEVAEVTELRDAKTVEELLSGEGTVVVDPTDYTSATSTLRSDGVSALAERPASFDLRACDLDGDGKLENYVTPVKLQNPFGTCWTFGSTAAVESSLLTELQQGVPAGERNDHLNISEKDLVWFVKNPQPSGTQAGEGIHTGSEVPTNKFSGGFISTATSSYAMGNGPVDESMDPVLEYHNSEAEDKQYYVFDLTKLTDEQLQLLGLPDDYALDVLMEPRADGDWSIPEDWRGVANWELEQTYYLPSPASFEATDDPKVKTYKFNQEGVDAIKDQLLAGRGVGIGFCADASLPGQADVPHYKRPDTSAHYTYESPNEGPGKGGQANHAVCIVGYDDTYSKENFYPEHQPEGDGAFIVKNSWGGNDTSDPKNYRPWGDKGEGYFYLSYYDKSILMPEAFDFITPNDTDSSLATEGVAGVDLYQHSFLPNDPTGTNHDGVTSYANVYEIRNDSVIRDVATQTYSLGTHVRFDIYLMDEGATNPSDGTLLWSHEETFPYGGYHRVELDKTLSVAKGDKVGVVCTSQLPNGDYEVVNNQNESELSHSMQYADPTQGYWSVAVVNPGESFLGSPSKLVTYDDGTTAYEDYAWADYSVVIDHEKAQAKALLDKVGFDGLLKKRDDAYAAMTALTPEDSGYAAANEAYQAAQKALEDSVESTYDNAARPLFYAQDNFPLNITTAPQSVDMFRLYNPYSTEHLYTSDAVERDALLKAGWEDEGTGWKAPKTSDVPGHRLLNPNTGEHLYTVDENEVQSLVDAGWRDEGVKFQGSDLEVTEVYRLSNPYVDGPGAHHYTTSTAERDQLVKLGWNDEGTAWYGL